jgi:hypothetical protein
MNLGVEEADGLTGEPVPNGQKIGQSTVESPQSSRRRRFPLHELRRDSHVKAVPGVKQHMTLLEPRRCFEEGGLCDAEGFESFGTRERNPAFRLEGRDKVRQAGARAQHRIQR